MNKLGDMLLELRNPATPQARVEEIARRCNEWSDREEKYSAILSPSGVKLENPVIKAPTWLSSPLALLKLERTTNTAITTGTDTYVDWENVSQNSTMFTWDIADPARINLVYVGSSFMISGIVGWEANATGYRNVKIEAFDQNDVSLGSGPLYSAPGWTGSDNYSPFAFVLQQNAFPTMASFKMTVGHTRGSNLNLLLINMGVFSV